MDEKVGLNPRHKCLCKDTHPGLGPHTECKKRSYHLCGCGKRSTLEAPDTWITTASSILYDDAHRKDTGSEFKRSESVLDEIILAFLKNLIESPLDKCIRHINEIPQQCAVSEHYHAHHFSKRGLIHMCLSNEGEQEQKCAELIAQIMIAAKLQSMDLVHVGGGQPAFHSPHVEMDDTPLMGIHIDPIRRN